MTVNNGCYARKCTSPLAPSATGVFLINHEGICDMAHTIREKQTVETTMRRAHSRYCADDSITAIHANSHTRGYYRLF